MYELKCFAWEVCDLANTVILRKPVALQGVREGWVGEVRARPELTRIVPFFHHTEGALT